MALPFSDTINFTGTSITDTNGVTKDATRIEDTGNWVCSTDYTPAFSYTHNVTFDPEAISIENASLAVTYTGNQANCIEAWFISDSSNDPQSLGYLSDTQDSYWDACNQNRWNTTVFDLDNYIDGVSGSSWSIEFIVDEKTWRDNEVMYLAESTISGNYNPTPVPEPATLFLLGTGLLGFAGTRKKKMVSRAPFFSLRN